MENARQLIERLVRPNLLQEGFLGSDTRTDTNHYIASTVQVSSHPNHPQAAEFSKPTGEFALVPYEDSFEMAWEKLDKVSNAAWYTSAQVANPEKDKKDEYGSTGVDFWAHRTLYGGVSFEVNHPQNYVNFNMQAVKHYNNRRPKGDRASYTIHATGDKPLSNPKSVKLLMDVAKLDPAILNFEIKGQGVSVRDFIQQRRATTTVRWSTQPNQPLIFYHGSYRNDSKSSCLMA